MQVSGGSEPKHYSGEVRSQNNELKDAKTLRNADAIWDIFVKNSVGVYSVRTLSHYTYSFILQLTYTY